MIESVREPAVKLVEGFSPVMIAYDADAVPDDDLEALIAFLREDAAQ